MKKFCLFMAFCVAVLVGASELRAQDWLQRGMDVLRKQPEATEKSGLADSEVAEGLREALRIGSENVVSHLGREDGYYLDPKAHIPLPASLQNVQNILKRAGMGHMLDDLELRMNRAAEQATPRAREMFVQAISEMTLDDVRGIYNGPDDAATRYFEDTMSGPLSEEFTPLVRQSLADVGAVRAYEDLMSRYQQLPFVPDARADISKHVVDHSIEAIFDYLALEEAAIRNDPLKQTTSILQRVFGR